MIPVIMGYIAINNWEAMKKLLRIALPAVFLGTVLLSMTSLVRIPVVTLPLPKWVATDTDPGVRYIVVLTAVTNNISDAIAVIREERARTCAERDAFDTFLQRVDSTPVTQEISSPGDPRTIIENSTATTDHLQQIQQAYEDTVMNVAHYEEEYDDTVAESMSEEFGSEIAFQIVSGQSFTPPLKQQLLETARRRRRSRTKFLSTLETEQKALETAQRMLDDAAEQFNHMTTHLPSEQSLSDLITTYSWLEEAEQECNELLTDRQQQRIDGHTAVDTPRTSIPDLQTYLYHSLPVTYPVLADTADFLEKLQRTRRQITRELAARR